MLVKLEMNNIRVRPLWYHNHKYLKYLWINSMFLKWRGREHQRFGTASSVCRHKTISFRMLSQEFIVVTDVLQLSSVITSSTLLLTVLLYTASCAEGELFNRHTKWLLNYKSLRLDKTNLRILFLTAFRTSHISHI